MKGYVVEGVAGGAFGMALAIAGLPFTVWQFWLLMVGAVLWRHLPKPEAP